MPPRIIDALAVEDVDKCDDGDVDDDDDDDDDDDVDGECDGNDTEDTNEDGEIGEGKTDNDDDDVVEEGAATRKAEEEEEEEDEEDDEEDQDAEVKSGLPSGSKHPSTNSILFSASLSRAADRFSTFPRFSAAANMPSSGDLFHSGGTFLP